ncbi:MAG: hypothetical protein ACRCVH_11705 [Vagococcus fluvialis]
MKKANYEEYLSLQWISVECPYCDFDHTLFTDERNVSSKNLKLPEGGKVLCSINDLADVHVTKTLTCNGCKKKFEIEGALDD